MLPFVCLLLGDQLIDAALHPVDIMANLAQLSGHMYTHTHTRIFRPWDSLMNWYFSGSDTLRLRPFHFQIPKDLLIASLKPILQVGMGHLAVRCTVGSDYHFGHQHPSTRHCVKTCWANSSLSIFNNPLGEPKNEVINTNRHFRLFRYL